MRIIIVGGGTAGWLAALMISKVHGKTHDITLIESSKIGIVGAGEGSTGYLTDIIQGNSWNYGCNEMDFLRETNATVKLGIKHRDWKRVGHHYYGPIDGTNVQAQSDYLTQHAIVNDIPFHMASYNGYMIHKNKSTFSVGEDGALNNNHNHAYHFDAFKVGQYFKKVSGDDVAAIDSEVVDVHVDEQGFITHLTLSDGRNIYGDFFVDCSGFKRIFANKLDVKWHSYSKNLPVNTAMPFLLPYEEDEKIEPVTTAWAQTAGWMWNIPTQARRGCGYVFDDRFISHEQAQSEIEAALGKSIEPIRFLKFDTGRSEKLWHKNCLFLGLSAAFAEPLEATSIHSTIVQLQSFVFDYLRDEQLDTCNPGGINIYNRRMSKMYDDFKDFLVLHYMTPRDDSEFWRWMNTGETMTDAVRDVLELQKSRCLQPNDFEHYYGSAGASLFNWIMAGLGYMNKAVASCDLDHYGNRNTAATVWLVHEHNMEQAAEVMIDNTDFVRNADKYLHADSLS
jgi:hypothetical protein